MISTKNWVENLDCPMYQFDDKYLQISEIICEFLKTYTDFYFVSFVFEF